MNPVLPAFNWSLQKLLETETGTFNRARIKILYFVLLLAIIKAAIVSIAAFYDHQEFQLSRAMIALVFYTMLLKLLLSKVNVKLLIHAMIWMGLLIIWTNIFVSAHAINIITLQFIFMLILSSFYLLDKDLSIVYSTISIIPVLIYLFSIVGKEHVTLITPELLSAPSAIAIIVLNFVTILLSHYLYHQAFNTTISEKESLNAQLKQSVEEANILAQSKSDFLSTMSHELRTPLNAVIGMSDLLMEDASSDSQKENLQALSFSALSLYTLINDILDFNKLESGRLELETIPVNLAELMHNICSGMSRQANEKGLDLVLKLDEELRNLHVITDPTRLTQIIYNLAGNGIKFTRKGKVTVSLRLIDKNDEQMKLLFSVADTGIGIPEEKYRQIFEPFVQASTSTTRKFGGTGLGLSIVKRLLTLFGSDIQLKSTPGKGSEFFFEISLKRAATPAPGSREEAILKYDLSGLRVLVAEDNPMNVLVIKKFCVKWNIEPVIVGNGKKVMEQMLTNTFDVILMDIHMPEMDGYEATKAIRQMPDPTRSQIPVIALTASVSHNIHERILEAGMNEYIRKPFNAKELYARLNRIRLTLQN
jgi:two-component system, sensor histidine kinase